MVLYWLYLLSRIKCALAPDVLVDLADVIIDLKIVLEFRFVDLVDLEERGVGAGE